MDTDVIDQVHVIDPRRTGRHAPQTRQTAVDVEGNGRVGVAARLEHILDEIDAPARAVEFVAA